MGERAVDGAEEARMAFRSRKTDAEDKIRPEVRALAERGSVTREEWESFRGNSWEFELIMPRLTDEALLHCGKTLVGNCVYDNSRPYASYNESVMGFLAPELLRRLKAANEREAQARYDGAVEALREVARRADEYAYDSSRAYAEHRELGDTQEPDLEHVRSIAYERVACLARELASRPRKP